MLLLWLLAVLQGEGAPDSTYPRVQVPLLGCKEAQDELIPTYPTPLFVLVSGCSMSSAAGLLSKRLLKAHGVAIADKTQLPDWEVLKAKKPNSCRHRGYWNNRLQQEVPKTAPWPDTSQMLANLVATAASNNTTLVAKFDAGHLSAEAAAFVKRFTRAGTPPRFVTWTRENRLDHLVCKIKDCFQGGKRPGGAGKFPLL
jgi:hypothetical protein